MTLVSDDIGYSATTLSKNNFSDLRDERILRSAAGVFPAVRAVAHRRILPTRYRVSVKRSGESNRVNSRILAKAVAAEVTSGTVFRPKIRLRTSTATILEHA